MKTGFVCPLKWNDLQGDGSRRYCGSCKKDVIDLTDCGAAEARARIAAEGGTACARYRVDALSRPLFLAAAVAVAGAAWAGPEARNEAADRPEVVEVMMGEVAWSPAEEKRWLDESNRERARA